jgi:tetratricopeptide (TPR) repeat protein
MKDNLQTGIRLYQKGKYEQALSLFLNLHVDAAEHAELSYYMGLCYTKLEKYDESLLYLEQVVTSDLGFAFIFQSRMILGYIYAITGRYKLAEFEFNRLIKEGFESAKVYAALAYVLYAQEKSEESLDILKNALSLEPENANALNSFGFILADTDKTPSIAVEYCKKALSQKPDNPAYLDSLGWAHFKNGDTEEARSYLRKSLSKAPRNKTIARHLKALLEAVQ